MTLLFNLDSSSPRVSPYLAVITFVVIRGVDLLLEELLELPEPPTEEVLPFTFKVVTRPVPETVTWDLFLAEAVVTLPPEETFSLAEVEERVADLTLPPLATVTVEPLFTFKVETVPERVTAPEKLLSMVRVPMVPERARLDCFPSVTPIYLP